MYLAITGLLICGCLGIFLSGFLLTRREFHDINNFCLGGSGLSGEKDLLEAIFGHSHSKLLGEECNIATDYRPETKNRKDLNVLLFIVDALRLDMFLEGHDSKQSDNENFETRAPFGGLHTRCRSNPRNCVVLAQHADPPTTTSQRLKAIMTGTMPTFIDGMSNLDSPRIREDNILEQLWTRTRASSGVTGNAVVDAGSSCEVTVLGDDTWFNLFPGLLNASHSLPFDSVDTRDFYSVDRGVEQCLFTGCNLTATAVGGGRGLVGGRDSETPALFKPWRFLVAHFLGVDHVGHTLSAQRGRTALPPHEEGVMAERLGAMGAAAERAIAELDALQQEYVFVLMGDHGMTDEGNHGGATDAETSSVFFVYSSQALSLDETLDRATSWNSEKAHIEHAEVADMLSNPRLVNQIDLVPTLALLLGLPLPFSNVGKVIPELGILFANAMGGKETSPESAEDLITKAFLVNSLQIMRYLERYSSGGTDSGINFDVVALRRQLQRVLDMHIGELEGKTHTSKPIVSLYEDFVDEVGRVARRQWTAFHLPSMNVGLGLLTMLVLFFSWHVFGKCACFIAPGLYTHLLCACGVIHAASSLSNSFVEHEASVLLFLVQMGFVAAFLDAISSSKTQCTVMINWWSPSPGVQMCFFLTAGLVAVLGAVIDGSKASSYLITIEEFLDQGLLQWNQTGSNIFLLVCVGSTISALIFSSWKSAPIKLQLKSVKINMPSDQNRGMWTSTNPVIWNVCIGAWVLAISQLTSTKYLPIWRSVCVCIGAMALCQLLKSSVSPKVDAARLSSLAFGLGIHCSLLGRLLFHCTGHSTSLSSLHLETGNDSNCIRIIVIVSQAPISTSFNYLVFV
jgi:predicted AlkP superfamily pyrophosphatase or phosphodiesterase